MSRPDYLFLRSMAMDLSAQKMEKETEIEQVRCEYATKIAQMMVELDKVNAEIASLFPRSGQSAAAASSSDQAMHPTHGGAVPEDPHLHCVQSSLKVVRNVATSTD